MNIRTKRPENTRRDCTRLGAGLSKRAVVFVAAGCMVLCPALAVSNDEAGWRQPALEDERVSLRGHSVSSPHRVPLFPAAANPLYQGFVRVINRSDRDGEVAIAAIDDAGNRNDGTMLLVGAYHIVHFNSNDLENGNPDKALYGGTGTPVEGSWRLEMSSDLDVEVLAYIRTVEGLLVPMHDVVENDLVGHRVAIFNPGRNRQQVSLLRLINPGAEDAEVTIAGIDDAGVRSGGAVHLALPVGSAMTLSAAELESVEQRVDPSVGRAARTLAGELGTGTGKWQLRVDSEQPIVVMSLLESPAGHLTNLSTAPLRASGSANTIRRVEENAPPGAVIGDPVTANLGDGASLTHTLEGPDADSFDIDSESGQLRVGQGVAYNFEMQSTYELIVRIMDEYGNSVRIGVIVEITDEDEPPGKPDPPLVEGVSSRSVRVTWDEPENTGPEIDSYDVAYRRPGAREYTCAVHEGLEREIEIDHLRPSTDYEFRVRASNAEGFGEWSEPTIGRARTGGGGGGGGGGKPPPVNETPPTVTISGPVSGEVEEGARASFTLHRSGDTVRALEVNVSVSETGDMVSDENESTHSVTFVAGSNAVEFDVPTVDDTTDEADSTLTVSIVAMEAAYRLGGSTTATVTVRDDDGPPGTPTLPAVRIFEVGTGDLIEGSPAMFALTRTGDTTMALPVQVLVSETGDMVSAEYEGPTTATLAADSSTFALDVPTVDDTTHETVSTITAEIFTDAALYTLGSPHSADVGVQDDDPSTGDPVWRANWSGSDLTEGASGVTVTLENVNPESNWTRPQLIIVHVGRDEGTANGDDVVVFQDGQPLSRHATGSENRHHNGGWEFVGIYGGSAAVTIAAVANDGAEEAETVAVWIDTEDQDVSSRILTIGDNPS